MEMYSRKAEILCEFQNTIESTPVPPEQLYQKACSNDTTTIDAWKAQWLSQIKTNKARLTSLGTTFAENGVGKLYASLKHKPCIIAGAGPSLKINAEELKNRNGITLISCLHNFHFFEDLGVAPEYYVSLDAGAVTLEEVCEGGTKTQEEYWEITKDRTLLCFTGTYPALLEKWKGKIYYFNCPIPDENLMNDIAAIEPFFTYASNGGNVLGSCLYLAKGIMAANPICFIGADFCFSYDKKFHAWNSKYDAKLGYVVKAVDVFGNKVLTWQSYMNFKMWFDYIAESVPGIYINCTEGGCFGAYPEGNIKNVVQMALSRFIRMYNLHMELENQCLKPGENEKKILF